MSLQGWTIETPVAPWSVVVDGDTVVASGFTGLDDLVARLPGEQVERVRGVRRGGRRGPRVPRRRRGGA